MTPEQAEILKLTIANVLQSLVLEVVQLVANPRRSLNNEEWSKKGEEIRKLIDSYVTK